jgi:large subunit ribosomal protein L18
MKVSRKTTKLNRRRVHARIRKKVVGRPDRPRLAISFTGQHVYAQIIDDALGQTLVAVSTTEKAVANDKIRPNVAGAVKVGQILAERAKAKNITNVVFDRGGFRYHGKVKALADAAREGGLGF